MRTLLMSAVAAMFVAGTAYAADVRAQIDADGDGQISAEEWDASRAGTAHVFGEWDTDGDNMLSRDEYDAGVGMQADVDSFGTWDDRYADWDEDGDSMLSADEYNRGLWQTYDADESGFWSQDETSAWEEDEMRYDATRMGAEVNTDDSGSEAGAAGG